MKRNICFSKKEYTFLQQRLPLDFLAERILKNNTLNPFKNEVSHPLNSQFSILNSIQPTPPFGHPSKIWRGMGA
jgi:hypothetical protein